MNDIIADCQLPIVDLKGNGEKLAIGNRQLEIVMSSIIKDIRFALRGSRKHPAFMAIAIVTLALGIGGSTSIFTVVDAALLRGLPYKSPDRLYHLWEQTPQQAFPKRSSLIPTTRTTRTTNRTASSKALRVTPAAE